MSIDNEIKNVIATQLELPEGFNENLTFQELGVDSLDAVEVIMLLEDKFNIEIPDTESQKIKTVKMAIEAIKSRL
jgi:acyl carrier protein